MAPIPASGTGVMVWVTGSTAASTSVDVQGWQGNYDDNPCGDYYCPISYSPATFLMPYYQWMIQFPEPYS